MDKKKEKNQKKDPSCDGHGNWNAQCGFSIIQSWVFGRFLLPEQRNHSLSLSPLREHLDELTFCVSCIFFFNQRHEQCNRQMNSVLDVDSNPEIIIFIVFSFQFLAK